MSEIDVPSPRPPAPDDASDELEPAVPEHEEAPPWKAVVAMFVVVALIAAALISICFLAAKLATGHAF